MKKWEIANNRTQINKDIVNAFSSISIKNLLKNNLLKNNIEVNYPHHITKGLSTHLISLQPLQTIASAAGGSNKIYILGRNRKIIKIGRKKYIIYKKEQITLSQARKIEKKLNKNKNA